MSTSAASAVTVRALGRRDIAAEGDTVLYADVSEVSPVLLKKGGSFEMRFGRFWHDDIIGKPYGSKVC